MDGRKVKQAKEGGGGVCASFMTCFALLPEKKRKKQRKENFHTAEKFASPQKFNIPSNLCIKLIGPDIKNMD